MDGINTDRYSIDRKRVVFLLLVGISVVLLITGVFVSLGTSSSPDLEISEVSTGDSSSFVEGETGTVRVVIENAGNSEGTADLTVNVSDLSEERENVTVEPNSSTVVEFDSLTEELTNGRHTITATLGNNISESSTQVTVLEPAQFTISDLRLDGSNNTLINPGDDFNVSFTVQNVGGAPERFESTLYLIRTDVTNGEVLQGPRNIFELQTVVSDRNEFLDVNSTILNPNETENVFIEDVSSKSSYDSLREGESYEFRLFSETETLESDLTVRTSPRVRFSSLMFGNQTGNQFLTSGDDDLFVTVENLGEVSSSFNISASVDNKTEFVRTEVLNQDETQDLEFDDFLSELSSGEYELRLSSQQGQSMTRSLEVVDPSNLKFENIGFEENPVQVGEENSISVSVTNTGDLQGQFNISLRLNDTEFSRSVVLDGRESRDVVFENTNAGLGAGNYTVSVFTDENESSIESNLSVVEPAGLSSGNLTLVPESSKVTTLERVDLRFNLQNTGDVSESYQVFVQLTEDGELVQVLSSRVDLQGNETESVEFTNITEGLDSGEYSVDVVTRNGRLSSEITVVDPVVVNGEVTLDNRTVSGANVSVYRGDELVGTTSTNQSGIYDVNVRSLEDLRVLVEIENQGLQDNRTFFGSENHILTSAESNFSFTSDTNLSYVVESEINNSRVVASYSEEFVVSTVYQLQAISQGLNESYTVVQDINAIETASWQSGGFELIGSQGSPFTGSLSGYNNNTYEVSNLTVQDLGSERFSIFSSVEDATVRGVVVRYS